MKILKRLFVLLFVLVMISGIGLYIFISTFDANKYKPLIVEKGGAALGRTLDFKDISLQMSLSSGIRAAIHDLKIGENPAYGKGDFVQVSEVLIGVNILDYITKKEVNVSGITVQSPQITVIKGADGKLSVETIGKKKEGEATETPGAAKAAAIPAVLVKQLSIKDGTINLIDRSQGEEMKASITHIDFGVEDFSFTEMFPVWLKAAAFADNQNISIKGRLKLDKAQGGVTVNDLDAVLDLTATDAAKLKTIPSLKGKPLPEVLKGKLTAKIGQFSMGKDGLGPIAADITLENGALKMAEVAPGVALDIPALDFSLKGFAPGKAGAFEVKLAYLSSTPNITANGNLEFDPESQRFSISGGKLDTDLSTLALDKLKASVASLNETKFPTDLKGKLSISGLNVKAGGGAAATYSGNLTLTDGSAKLEKLPTPLENINANIGFTESNLDIGNVDLNLGKGSLTAKGKVMGYPTDKRFGIALSTKDIAIESLLDQSAANEKIEGMVTLNLSVNGSGKDVDNTLSGKGDIALTNGKLVNVNVLARVLDKINIIPNFRQTAEAHLPRVWQQKLQKPDTEITRFTAATTIDNGIATITPIDIEAEGFLFDGTGQYALPGKAYALEGSFIIPKEMAAELAGAVQEMQYLMTAEKDIRFPLKVEGAVGGKANFSPDVKFVMKNAIQNKGKDQLLRVLDKKWNKDGKNDDKMNMLKGFLGGKEQPAEQPAAEPVDPAQQAPASEVPASQAPASEQPQSQMEPAPAPEQQPTPQQELMKGLIQQFGQ